jgi:group I intron endonuclease
MEKKEKKFKAYVYMLIPDCDEARANGDDKKVYIGQTDDIKKRQADWRDLYTPYAGEKINRAREKYGWQNWKLVILEEREYVNESTRDKKLDDLETKWIKHFNSVEEGFNTSYGRGMKGIHHTEDARRKMSLAKLGVKRSEAARKAISDGMRKARRKREREQRKLQALGAVA